MERGIQYYLHEVYHLIVVFFQLIRGVWRISRLPRPIVTIFGGSHMGKEQSYFKQAALLSERLIAHHISILTGGGAGIMEAVHCIVNSSSHAKGAKIIGIGVKGLDPQGPNSCVHEYLEVTHFFARKFLLIQYSDAFVVFPGGYGTLDELAEIWTLMQTKRIPAVPIVLIGEEYWRDYMSWLTDETITMHGLLTVGDLHLFTVTDDLDKAFCIIQRTCSMHDEKK